MRTPLIEWLRANKPEVGIVVVTTLLTLVVVLFIVLATRPKLDLALERTFEVARAITSHAESVETTVIVSDRSLYIEGEYLSDESQRAYAAYSTTTIVLPDLPEDRRIHSFTHHNIAIGPDIYTKIETGSPVLQESIPDGPNWQHFRANDIPKEYADIAVPGPIIENLRLLDEGGTYLRFVQSLEPIQISSTTLSRYEFELSGKRTSGNLQTVMDRIGSGKVELWVDTATSLPHTLLFRGEGYYATTTFSFLNRGPITAPTISGPLID